MRRFDPRIDVVFTCVLCGFFVVQLPWMYKHLAFHHGADIELSLMPWRAL